MARERKDYPTLSFPICGHTTKLTFLAEREVNFRFERMRINGISYSGHVSMKMDGSHPNGPARYTGSYIRRDDKIFGEPTSKARERIFNDCYKTLNTNDFQISFAEADDIAAWNRAESLETEIESLREQIADKVREMEEIDRIRGFDQTVVFSYR